MDSEIIPPVPPTVPIHENLKYEGQGSELAFLMVKNIFFTVLTLGIYAAWGRTNQRRYTWGVTSFLGDRATYTGQGKELFKGWMKLVMIYTGLVIGVNLLSAFIHPFIVIFVAPVYVYLYSLVLYGGTRYRLGRTTWRGIHFGVYRDKEQTRKFITLFFKYAFLSAVTLGIALPMLLHEVRTFLTNRSYFGTKYFVYSANRREYCLKCYKGFFLSVITFGFYFPWFRVNMLRFRLQHTKLDGIQFDSTLTGKDFFIFALTSYLLSIVTLGLATPWILNRGNRILLNSIELKGEIEFESIQNVAAAEGDETADIAASEYDIELGF